MGNHLRKNTPATSKGGGKSGIKGAVGGWTDQDLSNPTRLAEARDLAVIATNHIQDDPKVEFTFSNPTIDVLNFKTQLVNGTNYRLEYSVEDSAGDHILYVTAVMYRPIQAPITRAEVVATDYALENINRSIEQKDRNSVTSTAQQNKRSTRRPR